MSAATTRLTYEVAVPNRQHRFRELVIFLAWRCSDDQTFGATKLNKLMWKTDFCAFVRFGQPVTGTQYQRLPNGPAPVPLLSIKRELIDEGALEEVTVNYRGRDQRRVQARREADMSYFSPSEINLIEEIVKADWGKSATQVSAESHGLAWKTRTDRSLIPYEAAYLSDEPITLDDIKRTAELVEQHGRPAA